MVLLDPVAAALAWLGRQGARAVTGLVLLCIAVPALGALVKPYVTEGIFVLLTIAFLRLDTRDFRSYLDRPLIVAAATLWTSLIVPFMAGGCCLAFDLRESSPDLFLALMLQGVASPMMASPALAALMGLDATLVLMTMVCSTALIPLTAPWFVALFIGGGLALSPVALGIKLSVILAGSALVGLGLRRVIGVAALERRNEEINGLNIVVLFVFVAAIMENVAARLLADPVALVGLAALAFGVYFAVLALTMVVFSRTGGSRALALGLMVSQRNLGLMLAATGGALPDLAWLYFALSQFPIYLSPQLLQPLARRLHD